MENNNITDKISILISSCDKFSDLWDTHIKLYKKYWKGPLWKTYLVTDKATEKIYNGVDIIVAKGNLDFPMRIKYALEYIKTDFILLTLDDYFLINNVKEKDLEYLVKRVEFEEIDYLMLYNRRRCNHRKYTNIEQLEKINLLNKYAITLYPAIWNKKFLYNSVKDDMSPWLYEPSLTNYARIMMANCQFCHAGAFEILDVVRKGKVLHKANRYFIKNGINIGNREIISRFTEIKLTVMDFISWYMPRKVFVFCKKLLINWGVRFFSED